MSKLQLLAVASVLTLSVGCAVQADAPTELPDETQGADEVKGSPVLEYATSGGFVRYNAKLSVWATGSIEISQQYLDGKTLKYTDQLSKKELDALLKAVPAGFSSLPAHVYRPGFIADVPSITISASGHTVTWVGMKGTPVATSAFQTFASKMSQTFGDSTEKELAVYSRHGGFAGLLYTKLTVKNGGGCHIVEPVGKKVDKDCFVDTATMIDLHAKLERKNAHGYVWDQYPSILPGTHAMDGIDTTITWDGPNGAKSVTAMTGVTEPATFRAVNDALAAIVATVEK
jgi:hypothetical protein